MGKWCPVCLKDVEPVLGLDGTEVCPECGQVLTEAFDTTGQEIGNVSTVTNEDFANTESAVTQESSEVLQLTLIKFGTPDPSLKFRIDPTERGVIIGRFDTETGPVDIDLSNIPEAKYISRKHAKIFFSDGCWYIEDLGSSNGTFLLTENDTKKVERGTRTELKDGYEIAFGNAKFLVTFIKS